MCHCFEDLGDMTDKERTEMLEEHSAEELRAEYTSDELEHLGIAA